MRLIHGESVMLNREVVFDEGSMEGMLRFQEQDNEFCRRLLAAIHLGRETGPVGVVTQPGTKKPIVNCRRPDTYYWMRLIADCG
jgi:hypothetical protein